MVKILAFWDIYGRIGRNAFKKELVSLKAKYSPDFIIANIDNISSGRWPIEKHIHEMLDVWVDIMTWGDHIFDNMTKIADYLNQEDSKLLRPANIYESDFYQIPWVWYKIFHKDGKRLLMIHLMWQVFMKYNVYNPFLKLDEILKNQDLQDIDAIVVDFHKETTAEWYGMWHIFDGKISLVFWTHTHIQTNDDIILPKGTSLISDIGTSWPLQSIIGADLQSVRKMFLSGVTKWKIEQSLDNEYVVNGIYVEIWDHKKTTKIEKIRIQNSL